MSGTTIPDQSVSDHTATSWHAAFCAVESERNFSLLNELLDRAVGDAYDVNDPFEFGGRSLTPLAAAISLGLEDFVPRLLQVGADPTVLCYFEGFLCGPLHIAALRLSVASVRHLLDVLGPVGAVCSLADSLLLEQVAGDADQNFVGLNALHVLVLRDIWAEELYRLLLSHGVALSALCRSRNGEDVSGLQMPLRTGNKNATVERLDSIVGEEVKCMIRSNPSANELNVFLELCSRLKREFTLTAYRCIWDIDFDIRGVNRPQQFSGQVEDPPTAMLYAVERGNPDVVRLLLYSGADVSRTVQYIIPFTASSEISLVVGAAHLALLRDHLPVVDVLLLFGVRPDDTCSGRVHGEAACEEEDWRHLSLLHLIVLTGNVVAIPKIISSGVDLNGIATRVLPATEGVEHFTPLRFAVLLSNVRVISALLECGASISDVIRFEAHNSPAVSEMFGGPSSVGFEDWVSALLTGDAALQSLIDRRTDLNKILVLPEDTLDIVEKQRLASPELMISLRKVIGDHPTVLRDLRPVHLAVLLQQPWALILLADAGVPIVTAAPCKECPIEETGDSGNLEFMWMPLDMVFLAVRAGGLKELEMLCRDERFGMTLNRELPIVPDITPLFFPRRETQLGATWAWMRLGPLELAILHRRVDMAVLLVRLGANLLHTVDHVSVVALGHYSVTDMCFRDLTPLHLCVLLDMPAAAVALLNEACQDGGEVIPNEFSRVHRQAVLSATCTQGWAVADSGGSPENEQWLWRDLTPLHLAILQKNYKVAELLIDCSSADNLSKLCVKKDLTGDSERSFSALLLAFEQNQKDLHRRIAKRSPIC